MATEEHKRLSSIIKSVHTNLRIDAALCGPENAWKKHCANEKILQEYSEAMQKLATHWETNSNKKSTKVKSRIEWVQDYCKIYFFEGELLKQRTRELDIASRINLNVDDALTYPQSAALKLLDVGSCYNPFSTFECFHVLPIDIAPARKDVFKCDFLNLDISEYTENENYEYNIEITKLPKCTFDVVVFSLLLEYLPCPEQRRLCCMNAYKLLKREGLLVIITPDSKHVGANSKFIKSWQYNLAKIGFSRIKYEKFQHIHCMAFRKCLKIEITQRWITLHKYNFYDQLLIPQDFNDVNLKEDSEAFKISIENKLNLLNELPYCVK